MTLPHSAEFNRKRREAYRQARAVGLSARQAGHVYWNSTSDPRFIRRVNEGFAQPVRLKTVVRESPLERQERAERRAGRELRYIYHNYYPLYVKAKLRVRDQDGTESNVFLTLAFEVDETPTRGQLFERLQRAFSRKPQNYPYEVLGISYTTIERVPDRRGVPPRPPTRQAFFEA